MKQDDHIRDPGRYLTKIDEIEAKTGLDFFPELDEATETLIETAQPTTLWGN